MDYRDQVFLAVAENMSFSKAAKQLFISQPAVTKHIKELESAYGLALFDRRGNKITLSTAGTLAYQQLKNIQQLYRELEFELGQLNDSVKGLLKIGASSTIAQYLIPSVMAAFQARYQEVELQLFNGNSEEMESRLLKNEIDIALVENLDSRANIRYTQFLEDEIVPVCGVNSSLSKRKVIKVEELSKLPLVLREQGSGTLDVVYDFAKSQKIPPEQLKVKIQLGSTESIKGFLENFDGLSLLSARSIDRELQLGSLSRLRFQNSRIIRQFRLAQRQGPEQSLSAMFSRFLLKYPFTS